MSVNGIPAGYALPNYGIPAGYVPANVQPYATPAALAGLQSPAALGAQSLGQPQSGGLMGMMRHALAALGFGGGAAPMPANFAQLPVVTVPAPAVAKPKPKPHRVKHRPHHARPHHAKPHHAKPKPHHAKPKPHVAKPAAQSLPLMAGDNGYVGSLPFGGIAGGIGGGVNPETASGPQMNATNQSGLAGGTNPLNQTVTNANTFHSNGYSSVENPYGAYGSMYGGAGPVLGWNNPLGYEPAGGYGASMSTGINLDTTPKSGISGFFSRLFGG